MIQYLLVVAIALSGSVALTRGEDNWPEFRGPTGQGQVTTKDLPLHWSATDGIAWKQPIPGRGWSSPVLQGQTVFLTSAVDQPKAGQLSLQVLAFDAATGLPKWNVEAFSVVPVQSGQIHPKNSNASPTPLIVDGKLYAHFGHHGTACLSLDGKVLWRSTTLVYSPVHGNGGSPVLVDQALIFSCDGDRQPFVAALNKDSGDVLWRTPRVTDAKKKFSFSTPLVITVSGKKQVISPGSGAVCAYDPATGLELWRVRYGEGYSVVPRPVFGHGLVFIATGYDRPQVMAIRPDGKGDVTDTHVAWTATKGCPNTPSLLLVGAELYMVSDGGVASCLEATTGKVHWQERLGGNYSASPVHSAGRIYFQSEEGVTVVLKAGTVFEKLATNDLGERILASPAAAQGALFIRTEQHLFRVKGT